MGTVSDYLETLDKDDRDALERVYRIAREEVAGTVEGTSYGMAALLFHGKGLVTALKTKKFLSLYPYSGAVVESNLELLTDFETTKGSIHFSAKAPLPDDTLRILVRSRKAEILGKLER